MWKPLFVLAVAASTFFITPSEGSSQSSAASSAFSSSYSSSGSSKSSASSSATSSSRGSSSKGNGGSGKPKCTKPNEVYDICPAPCPPRLCSVDERLIRCAAPPKPGDPECKPGCRCADGFVRNPQGFCVTRDQCPSKCGKNEVFSECPYFECRPQECSQVGYPLECATDDGKGCPGEPACICDDGFVRNKKGQCAPIENCPSCGGDPNAEAGCGVNCNKHCSDRNNTEPSACILVCFENACDCKDGFLYDDNRSKCVRPEECTASCGVNEIFSPCSNGGCGPWTCADVGYPTGCVKMDQKYCKEGCVCADGYVRENGICIPSSECPSCGGDPNATPGCGINCGRLCSNYNKKPVACPAVCLHNACDCKKGFVFDENRKICVRPKDCTPTCGNHEVFSECVNGGCEAKNCSQLGKPVPCVRPRKCIPGCLCEDGYLRAANGTCIPKDQCQIKCTGANEIYDPCPPICPPQTCDSIGQKYFCPLMPANKNSKDCHGACRCKPNYLRNKIGECISGKDCLKCTGPNEYFSCGGACDNVCATLSQQNQTNCPIVNFKCNPMCYCEEGYARDANNICIPIDECTDQTCGVNERLEQCPDWLCEPQSCKQIGFPLNCPDLPDDSSTPCPGPPACVCDYNFVRDKNGKCIPVKQCPSCGGDPNAESGCGLNCGRLCSNYDKGPVACPRICFPNSCDCKQGFVYDENIDQCVRPNQCTPVCGDDEQYSECVNGGCEARNCSQLGKPIPCVKKDPKSCIKGCICEEGSLRAANGTCVPEEDCDHCNKPHEHYDPCAPSCPPQTCESIGKVYHCPISPAVCKGACRCDKGFLRNKIGNCISEKDCLKCTGPHEFFSCGGACDNVCATLSQQNQTNCPIINFKCNPMCYCEDGYARDKNNICIPIEKCPPSCGVNERLESCPNPSCFPHKCSEVGFPIACADIPEGGCTGPPVCVCIDNYVRNDKGKCIPIKNCPSCGGDPNAVSGCGSNCGRLCSNYKKKNVICSLICKINGCDCRDGFVYDNNLKKCVRPEDCTPICGINEVYVDCANGGCDKRNCSQIEQPDLCIDPIKCIGGCVCQKRFLRTDNGTCVPEDQCPRSCTKKHEVYDPCPPNCPPETCDSIGESYSCPADVNVNCVGACRCVKGYRRNEIGECISEDDCLKCTGPNEHFSCGGACDNVCATLQQQNQTNCPIINKRCTSKCYCNEGYARDGNGICIPIEQCGVSCHGDPNAIPGCGNHCGVSCSDYDKNYIVCPAICYEHSCNCKESYVYDEIKKICVQPQDCTPSCEVNEVFDECANGGCRRRKCSDPSIICINPTECIGDCVCVEGYLYNGDGICVPENKCNEPTCGTNEVYNPCPSTCPPQTCESLDKVYICPIEWGQEPPCEPDCVCQEGFYRNKKGECISQEDCLKCMGPHEYFSCRSACDNVCATLNEQNQTNCPIVNIVCNPMCYCEEGYARNADNICIPISDCPEPRCGPNERYEENPSTYCEPLECSELGFPIDCPRDEDPDCEDEPICICKYGYVRDAYGICIPKTECPSCGGDPNAVSGCGIKCGDNTCADYGKNVTCLPMCYTNGCDCRKGFLYDEIAQKCVRYGDCTTCRANEVYDPCPSTCPPQTCESLDKVYICPIEWGQEPSCEPDCVCKKGFYRNKIGECISEADCLKCMGPHEYFSCRGVCDNVCATLNEQNQTNCPIVNIICNPMCYCEEGYARDDDNICIPIEDCSEPRCGPNEIYEENPSTYCEPLTCSELGFPIDCPRDEKPDCEDEPICICKFGYVRNACGICIPKTECPSCGGDPNAISGCGIKCGNTCADYGKNVTCLPMCYTNGCDCRKGLVYDGITKKCVRYEDCTPTTTSSPPSTVNSTEARARLDIGSTILANEFLYQIISSKPNENSVSSATSVMFPLAQLTLWSTGVVLEQLLKLLNLKSKDEIKSVFPELTKSYENQQNVVFEVATKYYANKGFPLSQNFISTSREYFDAGGENIDFGQNVAAANTINKWVSNRTHDKIQNLVSPDMFNSATRLVLVNAIYFNGNWIYQFNPNNTETKDFYKSNGKTVSVKMMYQQNSFNYAENEKYQALQMFYKGNVFSFLVILPRKVNGLMETVKAFQDPKEFTNMRNSLTRQKVQVYLPKMNIDTQLDISEILKKINITAMFDPGNNGFEGILERNEPVYVSTAIQKATITVNEIGTEAAAATAITVLASAVFAEPPKIYEFNGNHNFIYYLLFDDVPMFSGCFVGAE